MSLIQSQHSGSFPRLRTAKVTCAFWIHVEQLQYQLSEGSSPLHAAFQGVRIHKSNDVHRQSITAETGAKCYEGGRVEEEEQPSRERCGIWAFCKNSGTKGRTTRFFFSPTICSCSAQELA